MVVCKQRLLYIKYALQNFYKILKTNNKYIFSINFVSLFYVSSFLSVLQTQHPL